MFNLYHAEINIENKIESKDSWYIYSSMISIRKILKEEMDAPSAIVQNVPAKPAAAMNQQQIKDAYLVAATLWKEARGEGMNGMIAVMNVIQNREKDRHMKAKNMRDVVLKAKQFSCWNGVSNPDQEVRQIAEGARMGKIADAKEFQLALQIVSAALEGKLKDITGGARFYFNPKLVLPVWSKSLKKTVRIGNHDFYKEKHR